jgi:aminoglycoside phosphotransferase
VPPIVPPPLLQRLAPEWTASMAYQLVPPLTTWRLVHPDGRVRFAKIDTGRCFPTLAAEAERMVWAAAYLPVPAVVALEEVDGATVLITEGLAGHDATDPRWRDDVPGLVRMFGEGLAAFHRAVGDEWCPFRFDVDVALDHVRRRAAAGLINPPEDFNADYRHLTVESALALLEEIAPDDEDLVVCHGDYCPPNVLIQGGRVTGYVDLGELGVADRWRDIAIGAWSTGWNFGRAYEPLFYESYGVAPDPERIAFYRLLWACSS